MNVNIETMRTNHIDEVLAIEVQTSATPWSADVFIKEINSPSHVVLVATICDDEHPTLSRVTGFTGGQIIGNELHVHSLAVDDKFRRGGVGKSLVIELIKQARERDANSATLEVRLSNSSAIGLYEKIGFVSEGIRPRYYADNGEDAKIMWLRTFKDLDV